MTNNTNRLDDILRHVVIFADDAGFSAIDALHELRLFHAGAYVDAAATSRANRLGDELEDSFDLDQDELQGIAEALIAHAGDADDDLYND
jgi:hypothetical protein